MKFLYAFGWIPVPVFYVSDLFTGGFSPLVFILINGKYRTDEGLHQHELAHVEQAYKLLLLPHALLYLLSKRYRQWAEVQAYRKQIACYGPGAIIDFAVKHLANDYRLGITEDQAAALLKA